MELSNGGTVRRESSRGTKQNSTKNGMQISAGQSFPQRRKFLEWLGIGVVGAVVMKMVPGRIFTRRIVKSQNRNKKIRVIPNELAVKRGKRV